MHARTQEILSYLDSEREALERTVAEIPPGQRAMRPGPDRWSVAEVLEHLAIVERRIAQVLASQREAVGAAGREDETGSVLAMLDVSRVADRSSPVKATEPSQPREGLDADAALSRLREQRRALRDLIVEMDGLALGKARASHPRFGELNLYQWLLFLGAHEARHTAQIREIAATVRG